MSDCYGKGDVKSVRKIRNLGLAAALGIAVVLIGAVYGFTDSLVSLFNSEHSAELAAYAHTGMRLYFIGFLFAGINIVGAGFLSATERARESFVTSVMRGFVCIIGCSLLFAAVFGINGVWLSFPASELLTAIVMAVTEARSLRSRSYAVGGARYLQADLMLLTHAECAFKDPRGRFGFQSQAPAQKKARE